VHQLVSLVRRMREAVLAGRYDAFRTEFLAKFHSGETLARAAS
jgi:queuine/archaeosine tRNA-ribosyltransferase